MLGRQWYNHHISGKIKYQKFFRKLAHFAKYGMNIGAPIHIASSGELHFLQALRKETSIDKPFVFFDIGANMGEYSDYVKGLFNTPASAFFLFEPQQKLCETLRQKFGSDSRFNIIPLGVGSLEQELPLYSFNNIHTLSSLYPNFKGNIAATAMESIHIIRLDQFIQLHGITSIDLMKIDVEGHELEVLKGLGTYLTDGSIKKIQFEFGSFNISDRTYFKILVIGPISRIFGKYYMQNMAYIG